MELSTAKALVKLISKAVDDIEADTAEQIPGGQTTDLNLPVIAPEDALEMTPRRRGAMRTLTSASHQLLNLLTPVGYQIQTLDYSYLQTVAIHIVCRAKIADLIHAYDPDSSRGGIPVELLSQYSKIEQTKLTHVMRFLAIRNVFCELSENHWANSRVSLPLRSNSANTQCNFLTHNVEDIAIPALVQLPQVLLDDEIGHSWAQKDSATRQYYGLECEVFEWLAKADGGYRAERLGRAMVELTQGTLTGQKHYKAYDWGKLPREGLLIDVGGGVGAAAHAFLSYLPNWKIVIQDRPEVIERSKSHAKAVGLTNTNLEFEVADFFGPQPEHRVTQCDAYFLRHILHDWADDNCIKILTELRRAAKPSSKLLICEVSIEPGLVKKDSAVLSNGGMASSMGFSLDLSMMTFLNAHERSKEEYAKLFEASGWRLECVTALATMVDKYIFEGVVSPAWVPN